MSLPAFFWRYARHYVGWGLLAASGIVLFAAATAATASLIKPIFAEVLLAGDRAPDPLAAGMGAMAGAAGTAGKAGTGSSAGGGARGPGAASPLTSWKQRFNLSRQLDRGYTALKRQVGVGPAQVVYFVPILFVLVFLLRSLADFISGYAFQRIGFGITTDIRNDLYRQIIDQSSRFHAEHTSGELVSRVVSDVAMMQSAVSNRLLDLFQQTVTLVVLLVFLLSSHFQLALVSLIAAPLLLYPIVRFGKGMRRTSHRSQERMADLTSLMAEGIRGHRVVKAFGMEHFEQQRFSEATRRHLKVNLRAQLLAQSSGPVVETLGVLGAAVLLIYSGQAIRAGRLSAPELVQFLTTLFMLYDPIRRLNKVNLVLQEAMAAAQRVGRLLAVPNDIADRPGAHAADKVLHGIAFEGVGFSYDGRRQVLHQVDLKIRAGEIVALVGSSGAGKSTLVNLLPRFFDPDSGRLAVDGVDIRDLRLGSLRSLIGVVTQETVLFNDSVRHNIAYGRTDLPLERVREAAAAAYADEFIMQLPHGYDTVIGEAGLRLSGGQRQRLAIARALLKNAPILILDEATSQLDSQSEALVQKALYNLMQGRTTLVIAHRLSTVMKADRIVVMEAGRLVEEGSHDQLLALGGTYKRLYELQFRA
ncbi:MAG TPA: ABC transporter ATP-binding protein [Thermoanaerobaculia bacterium]|jgi:subfamily B ATP-binding cassette protein MsbA|nr:ABC transporter ATP-binding protein [Thermoanaerobaculia bacterium]